MTIYKFTNLTLPPTLEKRREVLEAFRTLTGQDDEFVQRRRAEIAAIRREMEDIRRCIDAIRRQMPELRAQLQRELKAQKYSPDQPRVPAGSPHGGEWTKEGGNGSSNGSAASAVTSAPHGPQRGPQYAQAETGTRTDASNGRGPISSRDIPDSSPKHSVPVVDNSGNPVTNDQGNQLVRPADLPPEART